MKIINNCGAGPSYKALIEAYSEAVLGRIAPTHMFVDPLIYVWFINKCAESRWGNPVDQLGRIKYLFQNAEVGSNKELAGCVWFRNYMYPELDVVLINVMV